MTREQRLKKGKDAQIVTVALTGTIKAKVKQRQKDYFLKNEKPLSWERAIFFLIEGR